MTALCFGSAAVERFGHDARRNDADPGRDQQIAEIAVWIEVACLLALNGNMVGV